MTELVEVAAMPETGAVGLDEDEAHAARSAVRVGARHHDDEVAHLPVGDERLLAGDDELITVADGARADALQVAAGAGLGHGDRADGFAGDHSRQPFLLLLFRAVAEEIAAANIVRDGETRRRSCKPRIEKLLDAPGVVREVAADPAIL